MQFVSCFLFIFERHSHALKLNTVTCFKTKVVMLSLQMPLKHLPPPNALAQQKIPLQSPGTHQRRMVDPLSQDMSWRKERKGTRNGQSEYCITSHPHWSNTLFLSPPHPMSCIQRKPVCFSLQVDILHLWRLFIFSSKNSWRVPAVDPKIHNFLSERTGHSWIGCSCSHLDLWI